MKKIILGALFAVMGMSASAQEGTATASAQVNNQGEMPHVSTSDQIRQLSNQLQLNEGQYIRLRDLYKARNEQITEINSMYSNDPTMRQAKLTAANQEFENQLAQSVSSKQYTAYLESQGRNPAGSTYQAGGYGGRSLEGGATNAAGTPGTSTPVTPEDNSGTSGTVDPNIKAGTVQSSDRALKVESETGDLKVKRKKEKVETATMEYKSDKDETKIKSKDGTMKAKSEKGKIKIETPEGKMKMKDGEVKVKPKKGKSTQE